MSQSGLINEFVGQRTTLLIKDRVYPPGVQKACPVLKFVRADPTPADRQCEQAVAERKPRR
jgi:hypothetical protein